MAIHECFGSIIGQVAEVSINEAGQVKVHKMVSVVDCGNLVNPAIARTQIESGTIFGLSAALFGKITIEKGVVLEDNFDTNRILSLGECPELETHFIEASDDHWGGLGEVGVPTVAPAVINAVYKLTRRRLRSLPTSDFYLGRS